MKNLKYVLVVMAIVVVYGVGALIGSALDNKEKVKTISADNGVYATTVIEEQTEDEGWSFLNPLKSQRNIIDELYDKAMNDVVTFVEENDPSYTDLAASTLGEYKSTVDYTLDEMENIENKILTIVDNEETTNDEKLEQLKEASGLTDEEWNSLLEAVKKAEQ